MSDEKPILFSGAMVRAILEGRKTQTRRTMKIQPPKHELSASWNPNHPGLYPYGGRGAKLWVRESWAVRHEYDHLPPRLIPHDAKITYLSEWDGPCGLIKRPSIFMPRWASRTTLEITGVRAERLQDINEEDARAEGAMYHDGRGVGASGYRHDINHGVVYDTARESYKVLWDSLAPVGAKWSDNPWVWVIEFKRVEEGGVE